MMEAHLIKAAAAARHGISVQDLDSPRRAHHRVRVEAMREIKATILEISDSALGRMFGDRDHTAAGAALGRYSTDRRRAR